MNLLLDTHIWIWSHVDPERRLSKRVARALTNPDNALWLSPLSVWEFLLLAEKGRVQPQTGLNAHDWARAALSRVPMHEAALTHEVAIQSHLVRLEHDDPADRFLAATAEVYELTLVTADERLLRGKGFQTLANR